MTVKQSDKLAGGLTRVAKSLARSTSLDEAMRVAEIDRASDEVMKALRAKAATAGGSLDNWAGPLANDGGVAGNFVESIRPSSLFYSFAARSNNYPLREPVLATAALEVGGEIGEGVWLPVVAGGFTSKTLDPRMAGGIVVVSDRLVRSTDPASFAVLRRELQRAAVAATDTAFLAVATDSITPIDALGPPMFDLRTALTAVNTTGSAQLMLMLAPDAANVAATLTDQDSFYGARLFPNMTPVGGTMFGVPAMVSDRITPGRIILTDATGFAVNEGRIDVDRAEGAALQMRTDPANEASELVALWQSNMVALRVISTFGAERARDGAVAILDGAADVWAGATI